jgi:adenylate cyclase
MTLTEQALARNPGHSGYYNGTLAQLAYLERDYLRAEVLIRQVSLAKFPLYHFVSAIIYAQRSGRLFTRSESRRWSSGDGELHKP